MQMQYSLLWDCVKRRNWRKVGWEWPGSRVLASAEFGQDYFGFFPTCSCIFLNFYGLKEKQTTHQQNRTNDYKVGKSLHSKLLIHPDRHIFSPFFKVVSVKLNGIYLVMGIRIQDA